MLASFELVEGPGIVEELLMLAGTRKGVDGHLTSTPRSLVSLGDAERGDVGACMCRQLVWGEGQLSDGTRRLATP